MPSLASEIREITKSRSCSLFLRLMGVSECSFKLMGQRKKRRSRCLQRTGLRKTNVNGPRSKKPLRLALRIPSL